MNEIDEIRQEMARIRHDLHEDVTGVVGGASEVMDWRSYWRAHPWLTSGVVLLAGYLLVPKRTKEVQIVQVPVPASPPNGSAFGELDYGPQKVKRSILSPVRILGWALSFAGPLALNAAQAYASVWIENQLGIRPKEPNRSEDDGRRNREGRPATEGRGGMSSPNYRSGRGG